MSLPNILVVGGAGYIGSHMVLSLQEAGYHPIVLDNLSKGHKHAVINAPLIIGDMNDRELLHQIFTTHQITAVMHFASFIEVGESILFPEKYYQNNVAATLTLLDCMLAHNIKYFIFSSTAAVYGEPQTDCITESHPCVPINPYGRSKYIIETVLRELAETMDFQYAALRYFNAAGADPYARLGECHEPESHLIPNVLRAAALEEEIIINGNNYPTPDGTCIRDYVHVVDLCAAHLLSLKALLNGKRTLVCNLGTGKGHSILEIIAAAKQITGKNIVTRFGSARTGDPAILVADSSLAKQVLQWQPLFSKIDIILQHAWQYLCDKASLIC